ncbi:hypothetical protein D3C80_1927860 [compost metagenome]
MLFWMVTVLAPGSKMVECNALAPAPWTMTELLTSVSTLAPRTSAPCARSPMVLTVTPVAVIEAPGMNCGPTTESSGPAGSASSAGSSGRAVGSVTSAVVPLR